MDRKVITRLMATGVAAVLGGCGIVPQVAQQTTAAALAPFTTAANAAATNMQVLGRGMQYMTTQTSQTARQISAVNNTARAYQPRPVAYQQPARAPRAAKPSSRRDRSEEKTAERKEPTLDILPKDVLARLTEDQAGLQHAAQKVAASAPVGETIFWNIDGRAGTATTESENIMGGFTCRTFLQTIALEDYFDQASVTACRSPDGAWMSSF